jgi:DNA-binding CsgD family transcriptional regulator/tetratricopeptide (TPR) repeat protein
MLLARIRALDDDAQAMVRATAIGGGRVRHDLLAAAVDDAALDPAIRRAILGHVLVAQGDVVAFRHPLLQEVAYDDALPGERAALHAAFARALERRPGPAGDNAAIAAAEVAHHWWRADRPQALRSALDAGREAERAHAPAEAAVHLLRALELWAAGPPPDADRADVLAHAAETTAWSGAPEQSVALVSAALELVDERAQPARAGLLHERRGYFQWWQGHGEEGIADYEEAVRLIPARPPSRERAFVLAGLGFMLMLLGRPARSREVCEEALEVARSVGAGPAEVRALATLGNVLETLGDRPGGIAVLRQARALGREIGDAEVLTQTAIGLCDALRKDGQLEEAVAVGLEGAEEAARIGVGATHGAFSALNAAEAALELGRWDVVERVAAEVCAQAGRSVTESFAHQLQGLLCNARGDLAAAEEHARRHRELLSDSAGPELRRYVPELEAEIALSRGRPQDAAREAAQAVELTEAMSDPVAAARAVALAVRAEAEIAELARAQRDRAGARAAAERAGAILARARRRDMDNPAVIATIEAEVLRAQGSPEPEAWATAARACEARRSAWEASYAWWRCAEAAMARSEARAVAADALARARPVAERLGARPLLEEIDGLARRARLDLEAVGETPARTRMQVPEAAREFGLTARELEVLEHVALGQTNREIGAELFISARTAGVHVSRILEKLGASTRTEAATAAHRLGLVP